MFRLFLQNAKSQIFQSRRTVSTLCTSPTNKFYKYQNSNELHAIIDKSFILQEKIKSYYPLLDSSRKAIQEKLKYSWTYHSNAIEGSTLTLGDTIFFLREGLTVQGKPFKDFVDAKNHSEAIDYLYKMIGPKHTLSPFLMKEINSILLSGITSTPAITPEGQETRKKLHAGQYKKLPNHVIQLDGTIHRYVDPLQVDSEMDNLFDWINNNLDIEHPIITSAIAHYNMTRIHPFDDGNGRGARILMNLILLKKEYPPAIIRIEQRKKYLECLKEADQGNLNPMIYFIGEFLLETQNLMLSEIKKLEDEPRSQVNPRR